MPDISAGFWVGFAACCAAYAIFLSLRIASTFREKSLADARKIFFLRREWLEAEFLKLASLRGIPRGLRWAEVDFDDTVRFARDRNTRQPRALVAVTIRFEAIEGGDMEDVEAVGNLRAATAIFHYDSRKWSTNGRALFNLNPAEAIEHYRHELELVG